MAHDDDRTNGAKSDTRDELRTIAFRLRELQRLFGMRVAQENRRLDAEGLDPVTSTAFYKNSHQSQEQEISQAEIDAVVETIEKLDLGDSVRVKLIDGTIIEGHASPIDYTPSERLRIEIESTNKADFRYELSSTYEVDTWKPIRVRRYGLSDEEWIPRGIVSDLTVK